MGYQKERRPVISTPAETLGTTEGTIGSWPPVTIITSTNNVNFTLPTPQAGLRKTVVLEFSGATGDVLILNGSTATTFNGSTANAIVVSSSQTNVWCELIGVTTAQWALGYSVAPVTSSGVGDVVSPLTIAGSTKVA